MVASAHRTVRRGVLALLVVVLSLLTTAVPPSSAAAGDIGFEGASYTGAKFPPTQDKPESKLWYTAGTWWADMWDTTSSRFEIFRLDRGTETWSSTEVPIDTRANTLADVLWNGTYLYVASHVVTIATDEAPVASKPANPARLYRYSYSGGSWVLDSGFPTVITNNSSESMTIDVDSTGAVWATWTQVSGNSTTGFTNAVYVNSSAPAGTSWGTPFVLPTAGSAPAPDDISAIVRFGGNKIGVLWSNQLDETVYWAIHVDGADRASWQGRSAISGNSSADDHLSIRSLDSDGQGRVFAAVKTSANDTGGTGSAPQLLLLVYSSTTKAFTASTIATVADCVTRPNVVLDTTNNLVRAYFTAPNSSGCAFSGKPGSIYEKTAPLSAPTFGAGRGTPVIRDADSANINDVTGTKQSVSGASGLVLLATNSVTKRYWHADIPLAATPAPVASFTASPTSGTAPLAVTFTDTSTGSVTAWSWDFGDGTTSTQQNPTHSYGSAGTYTVKLTATGPGGSSTSTRTDLVTANPPAQGSGITFHGATSAANTTATSLTLTRPTGAVVGDVVVAAVSVRGAPTIGAPSGWSLVRQDANATTMRTAIYVRRLVAGDPTSWTWTLSSSQAAVGNAVAYSGVLFGSAVDTSSGATSATASTSVVAPSVTTSAPGDLVLVFSTNATTATFSPPAGTTERGDVTTPATTYKITQEVAERASVPTGPTGTFTSVSTKSAAWTGQLVALRPA